MFTLLHISDLHFGPPYVERVGNALLAAVRELEPQAIVVSGDLTQRAKPEQFAQARAFLDSLPDVPRVVVPGNHDVPLGRVRERLLDPYRNYRTYISHELDQVLQLPSAQIVALNSTAPYRAITNGRIHRWQLDWCAEAFDGAHQDAIRIVVAHHHFAPAPDYEYTDVMPRAKRALDLFHELDVELILGGHLHRAYIGNSLDIYPGQDRQHGIVIVQCGTSTSRRGRAREREKNSFNLIGIDSSSIQITQYMYFGKVGNFAPMGYHLFPRASARFLDRIPIRRSNGDGAPRTQPDFREKMAQDVEEKK